MWFPCGLGCGRVLQGDGLHRQLLFLSTKHSVQLLRDQAQALAPSPRTICLLYKLISSLWLVIRCLLPGKAGVHRAHDRQIH